MRQAMRFLSVLVFFVVASAASADQGHDMSQSMQQGHDMTQDMHQGHDMTHGAKTHGAAGVESNSCDLGIHVTEAAERRPGGALHAKATAHGHAGHSHDQQMGAAPDSKGMHDHAAHAGAKSPPPLHERHDPQHGGEQFFMAPDKLRHLEPVYSERCGLRVIFYNAHSEPVRPDRFRAFVHVIPSATMEPERMRFLDLSANGTVLEAALGPDLTRPFEVELYVRFPESDDPELFNVLITK